MQFQDKVVVVTGASSGIGKAVTELFLREGAQVIMVSRNKEKAQAALEEMKQISSKCTSFPCDVSKEEQVRSLFQFVERTTLCGDLLQMVSRSGLINQIDCFVRQKPVINITA